MAKHEIPGGGLTKSQAVPEVVKGTCSAQTGSQGTEGSRLASPSVRHGRRGYLCTWRRIGEAEAAKGRPLAYWLLPRQSEDPMLRAGLCQCGPTSNLQIRKEHVLAHRLYPE